FRLATRLLVMYGGSSYETSIGLDAGRRFGFGFYPSKGAAEGHPRQGRREASGQVHRPRCEKYRQSCKEANKESGSWRSEGDSERRAKSGRQNRKEVAR